MKPRKPDTAEEEEEELAVEGRGRSAARREALSFDAMAMDLLALPLSRFKGLPVSPRLKSGLEQARTTVAKAARRRHLRHLSGLLRESPLEVEAIQAFLAGRAYVPVRGDEEFRDLTRMRDDLCNPETCDEAIERACEQLPHIDLVLLRRLLAEYQDGRDDKLYRAIYKELNRALDAAGDEQEEQEEQD